MTWVTDTYGDKKAAPKKLSERATAARDARGGRDSWDSMGGPSEAEARDLLTYIDPDAHYDDWLAVLMALHDAGDRFLPLAVEWSSRGSKFEQGEVEAKWRGFKADGGVTWATVPALAKQAGADLSAIARKHKAAGPTQGRQNGAAGKEDAPELRSFDERLDAAKALEPGQLDMPSTERVAEANRHAYEAIQHGAKVAQAIMKLPQKQKLARVPGVLGLVQDYYEKTAYIPHTAFSQTVALAFGSVILGQRWVTDEDNYASLYYVCLADTGTGKEAVKKAVESILDEIGLSKLHVGAGFTSESAVISTLLAHPCCICFWDEFGKALEHARTSSDGLKAKALVSIMEVWARQSGRLSPQNFATLMPPSPPKWRRTLPRQPSKRRKPDARYT
ncbi:MAG: PriCT-2 domain-containing protein [Aestuariivita sp.]|uniref:PriCT-2 domain-containing protein n=1 Tax=Aestuariivita sp. TaxID=1872407 RepID=UPI003BAE1B8A